MIPDVTIFGRDDCKKARVYQRALEERGVPYHFAAINQDPEAAAALAALYVDGALKAPTLLIKGRRLRNPTIHDLEKVLARADLFDPGLVHEEKSQRFVRYMAPSDAFVSYRWRDGKMILGHIEVDPSLRGAGLGTRLATEVFNCLQESPHEIRLTCSFLRRVAMTHPAWRAKFQVHVNSINTIAGGT